MSGEKPFFIKATVIEISQWNKVIIVKAVNGYSYNIYPDTPGISFNEIKLDQIIEIEITNRLTRVWSTKQ